MPKIVDQPRRRREVIEATFQVISQVGLEGATLRAIAEQAGFSTGVIGHYFSSKHDLLALIHRHAGHGQGALNGKVPSELG